MYEYVYSCEAMECIRQSLAVFTLAEFAVNLECGLAIGVAIRVDFVFSVFCDSEFFVAAASFRDWIFFKYMATSIDVNNEVFFPAY